MGVGLARKFGHPRTANPPGRPLVGIVLLIRQLVMAADQHAVVSCQTSCLPGSIAIFAHLVEDLEAALERGVAREVGVSERTRSILAWSGRRTRRFGV